MPFSIPKNIRELLVDSSAANAINNLRFEERLEDIQAELHNRPLPPFGPPMDRMVNRLTGQELHGSVLEGVMDRGNELNELRQFQALRNDPGLSPDRAARRVLDVVDRWAAFLQASGRTEMTTDEKARFASELAAAAQPSIVDNILDAVGGNPWLG